MIWCCAALLTCDFAGIQTKKWMHDEYIYFDMEKHQNYVLMIFSMEQIYKFYSSRTFIGRNIDKYVEYSRICEMHDNIVIFKLLFIL